MKSFFSILSKFRLPYRDDIVFSIIFLSVLAVPIAFSLWTLENYEAIKWPLWLLLVSAGLLVIVRKQFRDFRYEPQLLMILAGFIAWAALATIFSVDRLNSVVGFYPRFSSSLLFWSAFAIFIATVVHTLNRGKLEVLLKLTVFVSLLISVVGLLQTVGIGFYEGLDATLFPRVPSLLGNPDFSSLFVVSTVPIMLLLTTNASTWKGRLYYSVSTFVALWSIATMGSRGALVGLAAGLAVLAGLTVLFRIFRRSLWYIAAAAIVAVVLFGFFYVLSRPETVRSTVQLSESNISTRLAAWDIAGLIMHERPWFGSGLGNFHLLFESYRGQLGVAYDGMFDDAHNIFLQVGATGGVPFLLIFLLLLGWPVVLGIRSIHRDHDWTPVALLGGMASFVVTASFTPVTTPCYMLLGIFIAGLSYQGARSGVPAGIGRPAQFVGIVLGIAGAAYALCFFTAEILAFRGERLYLDQSYSSAHRYERLASILDPYNPLYLARLVASEAQLNFPSEVITPLIEKITQLHPDDGRGYRQKAGLYFLLYKKFSQPRFLELALDNGKRSIEFDLYFSERYDFMSYMTYETGRYDETMLYATRALSLNDKDFQSWVLLAKLYQMKNLREQTIDALNKAHALRPELLQLKILIRAIKQEPDIQKIPISVGLSDVGY